MCHPYKSKFENFGPEQNWRERVIGYDKEQANGDRPDEHAVGPDRHDLSDPSVMPTVGEGPKSLNRENALQAIDAAAKAEATITRRESIKKQREGKKARLR
jgi:hypothetical protein